MSCRRGLSLQRHYRAFSAHGPIRLLAAPAGLGSRLVPSVAVATRSSRGLPCSTRFLVRVPSLIPRGSPPLPVSSDFTADAAFTCSEEARPPQRVTGLPVGSLAFGPRTRPIRASTGTSRSCAAGGTTCVDDSSHGEPPSSHWKRAAYAAHSELLTYPGAEMSGFDCRGVGGLGCLAAREPGKARPRTGGGWTSKWRRSLEPGNVVAVSFRCSHKASTARVRWGELSGHSVTRS